MEEQTWLQAPQLLTSPLTSIQVPLQLSSPLWQHNPLEQLPEQHSPFCTQAAPSAKQVVIHVPLEQVVPCGQTLPQEPQLLLSICRFTHMPLQQVWPVGQSPLLPHVQAPLTHVSPLAQT